MEHASHSDSGGGQGNHRSHHAHMVADFRRRFWVSLILSIPILGLAPLIQAKNCFAPSVSLTRMKDFLGKRAGSATASGWG
jgi:hypothetical protein